ncbi:MAG: Hsp70 family protein, partial [Desulfobacterota bacterium]|nr:Hsp70 family protein [Thermodesulfobacteriota bacterium]
GLPQIEVTFDIDANGIVQVSAKDLGTGKEQSIKITASSGLSEEEIRKLVKDAEMHAEEDKKKKELAEARNHADTLIYSTEKTVKELGDKLESGLKSDIDGVIERLKKAMEGSDAGEIKRLTEELTNTSHKLAEKMYSQASQQGAGPGGPEGGPGAGPGAGGGKKPDDDVVDADFEEVK